MQGWIKLHRKILDWEWYSELNTFRLFVHLMLTANNQDKGWRGIAIKRGQRFCSIDKLSQETGLTPQNVRTAIKKLEATGEVTKFTTSKYTIITITNYCEYQKREQPSNKELTNSSHTNQQPNNEQSTTTKETQETREERNGNKFNSNEKISFSEANERAKAAIREGVL